jgi:hypothetical protein
MNIGLVDPVPSFLRLAGTRVRSVSVVSRFLWHPVRVVELVDTLRCERRAFGRAGSSPAAHKGRFMMLSQERSSYMLFEDLASYMITTFAA